jgi:peptidoglycan hydrolase CwlO-like protein
VLTALVAVAPAQDLQQKFRQKSSQLSQVQDQRSDVETSIAEDNKRVNDLIAEVAAVRDRAAAVRAKLEAKQAELDRATAELNRERRHLEVLRARLHRALGVLRDELVGIYETGHPDVLSVVLESKSWSEVVAQSEYLDSLQNNFEIVVERVRTLRDQTREAVHRMRAARDRIEAARDAIAVEERQIEAAQAAMEQRKAELEAVRAERQAKLDALQSRETALQNNLSAITDQIAAASPSVPSAAPPPLAPGDSATLLSDGTAAAPASAPAAVKAAIGAANQISSTPYIWGGGHGSWTSSGYDCSGAVSYALHGGGFLDSPLDSTGLETWGVPGAGRWITVYANSGHAWAVIAGLRWDTSGDISGSGPRWHTDMASTSGFIARHPDGY